MRIRNCSECARRKLLVRHRSICKDCKREEDRVYRELNTRTIAETHRKYYLRNKKRLNAQNKARYRKNKDRHMKSCAAWRRRNREKVRGYARNYNQKNMATIVAWTHRNRAKRPLMNAAQHKVLRAIESGELVRPKRCQKCKTRYHRALHAHHYRGYEFPLAVHWLCPSYHRYAENRRKKRAA